MERAQKQFKVIVPYWFDEEYTKKCIDKEIKKLFKNNTGALIQERLPYWSRITEIEYSSFKVRDAISRYGSCVTKTKALRFSGRLIMLPPDKIDAIIVHELCHIIHPNHSKDFYELVKRYIPDYKEIDKWLKKNNKIIIF